MLGKEGLLEMSILSTRLKPSPCAATYFCIRGDGVFHLEFHDSKVLNCNIHSPTKGRSVPLLAFG